MLKLGSEIPMKFNNPDVVDLIWFDVSKMEWGQQQRTHISSKINLFLNMDSEWLVKAGSLIKPMLLKVSSQEQNRKK